jgi:hypothetical protein
VGQGTFGTDCESQEQTSFVDFGKAVADELSGARPGWMTVFLCVWVLLQLA